MKNSSEPDVIVRNWIKERAESGVVLAQAVTKVSLVDGHMTIHIDPNGIERADEWPAAIAPWGGNLGDFYATEFGWTTQQSAYMREMVIDVEVVDAAGNRVGDPVDTADYQRRMNPQG
ncbi:proline racemase [Corynebacterium sp. UMB9976]|uniref:proline racemase n=1 Tax=Corynebacterium sp. UMB9976 TaxID=3046354 RepID=UPI00254CA492|nr:proline racemase [Corynebacterium sp. UMB9976]MDK6302424.1 proline racemase [Corynebacterium sp. UMB9976]